MVDLTVVNDEEMEPGTNDGTPADPAHTEATADGADRLHPDRIFGLLSNRRRRLVLRYLDENESETTLSELADHIARVENEKSMAALNSSERKRVYVGLYQIHLPKLDEANVIDYDQPRGIVERRAEADQLLAYLADDLEGSNRTDSWRHRLIPTPLLDLGTRFAEWNPVERIRHR